MISVIIPTYNGAERLPNLLDSLIYQEFTDFEVIVSIDGSVDTTSDILNNKYASDSRITWVEQENKGRATSRNYGASKATREFLYFVDDDMVLPKDHLKKLESLIAKLGRDVIIVGLAELPNLGNETLISELRRSNESNWRSKEPGESEISKENFRFTSQLLCIPSLRFSELEGFKDGLQDSEDFELCVRIIEMEIPAWYSTRLKGHHMDSRTVFQFIDRKAEYIQARKNLGQMYPDYIKQFPKHFPAQPSRFKRLLLTFFALKLGWSHIFHSRFIQKHIPRKLLFPLLNRIIYANAIMKSDVK